MDAPRPDSLSPRRGIPPFWPRLLVGLVVLYWLAMLAGTHVPMDHEPFQEGISDKWLHFVGYGGLAVLLSAAAMLRWPPSVHLGTCLLAVLAAYGALDEQTQKLVGRDCDLHDWYADVTGSLIGIALVMLLASAWRRGRAGYQRGA